MPDSEDKNIADCKPITEGSEKKSKDHEEESVLEKKEEKFHI